jgi:hypothetical protein
LRVDNNKRKTNVDSIQTLLTAVFCTASLAGLAMSVGGLQAEYSASHDRSAGMTMVAKAHQAGAVCKQMGPASFEIIDQAHPGKPFFTMNAGHFSTTDHDEVDGVALAMDGSRVGMSVVAGSKTCHVPFGIGDFALKVD